VSTTKYGDEEEEIEKTWHRDPTVKDSCPFYKRIAGTTFIVDDFRFIYKTPNTKSFFLSHFHSDHYQGLNSKFNRGIVYCSPITAALVQTVLRVPSKFIQIVPLRTTVVVEDVEVTFFDANHCPGAVVLLFRLRDGSLHLHTGDFRFDADLPDHIHLLSLQTTVANLYLDTTYADSRYTFPHQQLVISKVLELVAPHVKEPKTLIVVGTYTIGKERMFLALAERFGLKFYVKSSKLRILKCLDMELILREMASADMMEARIHVIPIFDISLKKLEAFLDSQSYWTRIVAIRPTGWAYSSPKKSSRASASIPSIDNYLTGSKTPKKTNLEQPSGFSTHSSRKGSIIIHSVPYSEHSSFSELCTVVRTLKPRWIIPTVNNRSREAVAEMVRNLRG
jgi:DNA cross-link repair 1A protein